MAGISGINSEIILEVSLPDGRTFKVGDFYSAEINTSVDTLSGTASFIVRWGHSLNWGLLANLKAQVLVKRPHLGTFPLVTGYVTAIERVWDESKYEVKINIAGKTVDLSDCNPVFNQTTQQVETSVGVGYVKPAKTYNDILLSDIVQELCRPFGINVIDDTQHTVPFEVVEIEETETVGAKIIKLCQEQAVFPYPDNHGNLVLSQFGMDFTKINPLEGDIHQSTPLFTKGYHTITDQDVLELNHSINMEKRFSYYKCYYSDEEAIVPEAGDEIAPNATDTSDQFVESSDPHVRRWRPVVIEMDTNYNGYRPAYAEWFQRIERARSQVFTVVMKDFFAPSGIYTIGDRCNIHLPKWGIAFEGLVIGTTYTLTPETGRSLSIQVVSLDNYIPEYYEPKYDEPITPENSLVAPGQDPYKELMMLGGVSIQDATKVNIPKME